MRQHGGADGALLGGSEWFFAAGLAAAGVGYLVAAVMLRQRGVRWPWWRLLLWLTGLIFAAGALIGPIARHGHHVFTVHMLGHVLLGMLAPLLLVLAAPLTLVLRALPARRARVLAAVLRSAPVVALTHPVTAAVLNIGGLWVLYRTDLYPVMLRDPLLHLVVHVHVLAAGYLFTVAMIGVDPTPHRRGHGYRAAVLVAAIAGHNVLAKTLYAYPPLGVPVEQAQAGSQVMYYGGAPVEIALIVVLCHSWSVAARRHRYSAAT